MPIYLICLKIEFARTVLIFGMCSCCLLYFMSFVLFVFVVFLKQLFEVFVFAACCFKIKNLILDAYPQVIQRFLQTIDAFFKFYLWVSAYLVENRVVRYPRSFVESALAALLWCGDGEMKGCRPIGSCDDIYLPEVVLLRCVFPLPLFRIACILGLPDLQFS